jgi:hypothetical protein
MYWPTEDLNPEPPEFRQQVFGAATDRPATAPGGGGLHLSGLVEAVEPPCQRLDRADGRGYRSLAGALGSGRSERHGITARGRRCARAQQRGRG